VQDVENRIRVERPASSSSMGTGVQSASGVTPTFGGKTTKQ
jgi:hypothetical protein